MRDNKNSLRNTLPQTQLPLLRKLKPWIGSNNFGLTKAMELTAKLGWMLLNGHMATFQSDPVDIRNWVMLGWEGGRPRFSQYSQAFTSFIRVLGQTLGLNNHNSKAPLPPCQLFRNSCVQVSPQEKFDTYMLLSFETYPVLANGAWGDRRPRRI